MAIADVYVGEIHFESQQNPNLYCFYYQITVENNEATASRDVAVHMAAIVVPLIADFTTATVVFKCTTAREVWPASSIVEVQDANDTPGDLTPGVTQSALPGQCSMVSHLYGDQANPTRSNVGTDFWTGFETDNQADGTWDTVPLARVQLFYETLPKSFTSANTNTFTWGHFSLTQAKKTVGQNGNPPVDPAAQFFWPVELVRINTLVRTQRRRQAEDVCQQYVVFDPNL